LLGSIKTDLKVIGLTLHTEMADTATPTTETRWTGCVKWFNNQAGYGFVTATIEEEEVDVFVHHSALQTTTDQFRYLVEGEYISFGTTPPDSDGKITATSVTGANGGKLMCETRWERKQQSQSRRGDNDSSDGGNEHRGRRERFRGGGPRQGGRQLTDADGTVWELVQKGGASRGRRGNDRRRRRPAESDQ